MAGKRADTLLSTMLFIEMYTLDRAWGGLTDDEFHREPLPGSWGVHPASEATDEQLEAPTRFWGYGGPGPETIGAHVVAATLNEVSHHATEVCVLRDLHRLTHGAGVPGT